MKRFYYSLALNPMKVTLFLDEAALEYEAIPVDTRKGDQSAPRRRTSSRPSDALPSALLLRVKRSQACCVDTAAILPDQPRRPSRPTVGKPCMTA